MKANELQIEKFLSSSKTVFVIPVYQRNYDWDRSHCKRLLDDIIKIGKDNQNSGHFIGSIVFVQDDIYSSGKATELMIIDGQQRLTTLTLLFAALHWYAKKEGNEQLAEMLWEEYLINKHAPETARLKLKPTNNNEKALKCVLGNRICDFDGYSRIIDNYNFFKDQINNDVFEVILQGINKLIFVEISLDRIKDNPQRIFESLNSTGLDLSQADLIRNYILMGLARNDQEKIYTEYWDVIEKNARDNQSEENLVSDYIRDYLTLRNKKIPNKNKVYETFKTQYPTTTLTQLEDILLPLKTLSKCYGKLINPSKEDEKEIQKHLSYIKQLEINVAYPFLMKVYEDYVENIIDQKKFIAVLELIQSYSFRRFVVGLPTNALNKVFMGLYDKVDLSNYLYSVQMALLKLSGTARFPRNTEIETTLKERDVYTTNQKNKNYLLERLNNHQTKEPVDIKGNPDITIEHIFPQHPDPTWETELGTEECKLIKEKYLHTIGNLTLSGNNGSLGNKSFLEKREMNIDGKEQGYRFSNLWLNRDLKGKERWGKPEIEERTRQLTERFLSVWGIPAIDIEETAENVENNIFEADDPTGKYLEYFEFFGQRSIPKDITDFFIIVLKELSERHPEAFFKSSSVKKIGLRSTEPEYENRERIYLNNVTYAKLNDTHYICVNWTSSIKFRFLKGILSEFGYEDELIIKYT